MLWSFKYLKLYVFIVLFFTGSALKCWECNSKYDARCGDPFSNFSVALVDCDQKTDDVDHLMEGFTPDDAGEPKATLCRKTYQLGKYLDLLIYRVYSVL